MSVQNITITRDTDIEKLLSSLKLQDKKIYITGLNLDRKVFFIKKLLKHVHRIYHGLLISEQVNRYDDICDMHDTSGIRNIRDYVYTKSSSYNPQIIKKFIRSQDSERTHKSVLVLDIDDPKILKDEYITNAFFNNRSYNMTMIIVCYNMIHRSLQRSLLHSYVDITFSFEF
jgi:hypothetical protein